MHGRVKIKKTEEQKEIIKQENCKKAKAYQSAMKIVLEKRFSSQYDQEALDVTANLLTEYPDIITLWNFRREIFLHLLNEKDAESYQQLLENDLNLTERCLRVNPKSYPSWDHRVWILNNLSKPNWERELMLCTKYLKLDERNFHCWDYRRIVTQRSNIPDLLEYKYTLEKIETNFSNYSAWHLRSKLLLKLFPDKEKKFPIDEIKHKEELELVESAAFTDPSDQSAWFYLRWLLGLTEFKISFVFVEAREEDIFIVMSKSIKLGKNSKIGVTIKVEVNQQTVEGVWINSTGQIHSCLWSFKPDIKIELTDSVSLILEENGVEYSRLQIKPYTSIECKPNFLPMLSESLMKTVTNQLLSCQQLLELEPDSKWTLLTSVFLMLSINFDENLNQIMEGLEKLCVIDPLRKGYYLDLRSKIIIESTIMNHSDHNKNFSLKNQNLNCFYHSQYLHNFEVIDLSNNALQSESMNHFVTFLNCRNLNLSSNKIKSLKTMQVLPKLEVLKLDDNLIEEVDWEYFQRFPCLKTVSLCNNPIVAKKNLIEELISKLENVKLILSS